MRDTRPFTEREAVNLTSQRRRRGRGWCAAIGASVLALSTGTARAQPADLAPPSSSTPTTPPSVAPGPSLVPGSRPDASTIDDVGEPLTLGAIAGLRIDGKGRGFAGSLGVTIAGDQLEAELMFLKADAAGGYLGGRYRFLRGWARPYGALGMPVFLYEQLEMGPQKLAIGMRVAVGIELALSSTFSVQADLGVEHFFDVADTNFDANVFVPAVGVIGRL